MAEENVKVDLQSSADTTGFEKFEASYNSLAAAKQEVRGEKAAGARAATPGLDAHMPGELPV